MSGLSDAAINGVIRQYREDGTISRLCAKYITLKAEDQKGVRHLNQRHYKILDLALSGHNGKQIAEQLNISSQMISVIINSPSFQHELSLRRDMPLVYLGR